MACSRLALLVFSGFLLFSGCATKPELAQAKSGYVDSKICASCHQQQGKTYQLTGMGRSFSKANPETMTRKLEQQGSYYHPASERYYAIARQGDQFFMRRHQKGPDGKETNVFEAEIHYVVGSGNHSRTYLSRTEDNHLVQLPVSWYSENGGSLGMSPGYDSPRHEDFRRKVSYTCFACHNAFPQLEDGSEVKGSDPLYPAKLPEGIDCQRCHGPGAAHLEALKKAKTAAEIKAAIVNPKRLAGDREMEVCLQCHLETTSFELPNAMIRHGREAFSFRPGEQLGDYQLHFDHAPEAGRGEKFEIAGAAYRLRQSACFLKSAGALRCTTCHNPHDIPRGEKAETHYTAVCMQCHEKTLPGQIRAGRHTAQANCTGCHMQKRRTEDVVHVAVTDHRIVKRPVAREPMAALKERHNAAGEGYRGEVALYYPPNIAVDADRQLYLAAAQVAQQSNLQAGIVKLDEAIRRHRPQQAGFYIDLGLAYSSSKDDLKAIAVFREALEKDGKSVAALQGLGSALLRTGDVLEAVQMLERARAADARDSGTLHELARAYQRLGRGGEAIAVLRSAVKLNPDATEILDTLGNMLLETGDKTGAEQTLREAIRRQPEFDSAYSNLANVLMAREAYEEAEGAYQKSIALNPANALARFNYGSALARAGRFPEAEVQFAAAVKASPSFAEAGEALGNLYARRREWRKAIDSYLGALRAKPQFGRARLGLGIVMSASGDVAGALPHLRQAASDPDAAVRQEAGELLQTLQSGKR